MPGRDESAETEGEVRPRLWATVLADLRLRLANGDFDDRFPTDRELMDRYGVSRHTAREAVRRLDAVDRRPRLGGRIRRPPGALENLGRSLQALGVALTLSPVGRARRRSAGVAAVVGVDAGPALETVTHVLLADGQPLLVSELWLRPDAVLGEGAVELLLGLRPSDGRVVVSDESVLPVVAPAEARTALHLPQGAAVFCAEGRLDVDGRPAGWHRVLIRPERYRCVVRWDPGVDRP
jgi:GntR family transcriptional regulator